jgi:spore maturation protein CgeB
MALRALEKAGIEYGGWIANFEAPMVYSQARVTVHASRRYYREQLAGIPTIRLFEALACGIPLVSAPWDDVEGLFRPGRDFVVAADRSGMTKALRAVLADEEMRKELIANGLETIQAKHTCKNRASELMEIVRGLESPGRVEQMTADRNG